MATYLNETFETGPPLHTRIASIYGEVGDPSWGSIYSCTLGYEANVIAGIGKDGSYGLGVIPGYENNNYWWTIFQALSSPGLPGAQQPLIDAGKGRVQFELKLYDNLWDTIGGVTANIFDVSRGWFDGTMGIGLILSNETAITGGGWKWYFIGSIGNGSSNSQPLYYSSQYSPLFSCEAADLSDGAFHTIEFTWQAGTVSQWTAYNNITILSDGWLKLTVDGVTIFFQQNIPLIFNETGAYSDAGTGTYHNGVASAVNRFTAVMLGDQGYYPGVFDNLIIGTPEELVSSPSISSSISASKSSSTSPSVSPSASPSVGTPVGMRLRLWDETNGVSVGESALINSTVPVDASFVVTLTPGTNSYKLQVTADESNVDLFVSGAVLIP